MKDFENPILLSNNNTNEEQESTEAPTIDTQMATRVQELAQSLNLNNVEVVEE